MSEFEEFLTNTVQVHTFNGPTGSGSRYADPVNVDKTMLSDSRRLVRDAEGEQVVSESTVYDTDLAREAVYAPGSKVVLPGGRVSYVILVKKHEVPQSDLPACLEVVLT